MDKRPAFAILAAIVAAGFWLRADSASWGLPFRLHPDEWKYVRAAAECHMGKRNPEYFRNPPGFSYAGALWYPLWLRIRPTVEVPDWLDANPLPPSPSDDVAGVFRRRPFDLVLGSRILAAVFGAAGIAAAFWLALQLNRGAPLALGAAALASVSFLSVRDAHFAVNDTSMAFWAILSVCLSIRAFHKNCAKTFLLAFAVGGVATAFKYSAVPALGAALALRLAPLTGYGRGPEGNKALFAQAAAGVAVSIAAFLAICPYPILAPDTFWAEIGKLSDATAQAWPGQEPAWSGFLFLESIIVSDGWLGCILTLTGTAVLIHRKRWEFLAFPILFFLMIAVQSLFFMRFSLPFLLWTPLAGALGSQWIAERIAPAGRKNAVFAAIVAMACIQPLAKDLRSNALLKETDTRVLCLRWLRTEMREPVLVGADQFAVPLAYWGTAEPWNTHLDPRVVLIDRLPSDQLDRLNTAAPVPAGWVLISGFASFPGYIPDTYAERLAAIKAFARGGDSRPEPSATARAYAGGGGMRMEFGNLLGIGMEEDAPSDVEDTYSPVADLWARERPGPRILAFPVEQTASERENAEGN